MQEEQKFEFNENNHTYTLDGKRLYGVTTILGVINKPALIQWAVNMAIEHININFPTVEEIIKNPFSLSAVLEEAKSAHRKSKESAATKGTDIHEIIEKIVKRAILENNGVLVRKTSDEPQVQRFIDWAESEGIKFIDSERRIYSSKIWVAGTCDLIFEKEGKRYVGDIKTTSGIYDRTPFMQCAAYQLMISEQTGETFEGRCIIRLGKAGDFEVVWSNSHLDEEGFLHALGLFKALEVPVTVKQKTIKKAVNKKKYK